MSADNDYTALADALDCFWNASLGSAKRDQDITAIAVASALSEGFSAMAARLREYAPPKGEKKGVTAEDKALAEAFAARLEANATHAEQMKFTVANLSTLKVDECRDLARILRAASSAAPEAPARVHEPAEASQAKAAAIKAVYLFADAVRREVGLHAFSPARDRAEQAAIDAISRLAALAVDAPQAPAPEAPAEVEDVDGYPERVWISKGDPRFPEDDVWTDDPVNHSGPTYIRADLVAPAPQAAVRAPEAETLLPDIPLSFTYRNHRGDVAVRSAVPLDVRWGSTEWHREPQWLMRALDVDKGVEREFAMSDMSALDLSAPQAAVSEEMLEAAMHAYHGEGYDGRLRGCCVDVGEEEREDMRRAITAALRTGNGDELAERARAALQAAHLACFQHPDRGPVGMSRGPFSGVNEVLGVVAQLLASLKLETARAEAAEREVERLGYRSSCCVEDNEACGPFEEVCKERDEARARAEAAEARVKAREAELWEEKALLNAVREESWDLRCESVATGGGDYDIDWTVVGHFQADPQGREIARAWKDDPREAIRQAIRSTLFSQGGVGDGHC